MHSCMVADEHRRCTQTTLDRTQDILCMLRGVGLCVVDDTLCVQGSVPLVMPSYIVLMGHEVIFCPSHLLHTPPHCTHHVYRSLCTLCIKEGCSTLKFEHHVPMPCNMQEVLQQV